MIRLLALLVLLLAPAIARAETVRVLSGEHADFSRLLVELPPGLGWTFGRVDGGYEFRSERADIAYDLSHAFDRIPRSRVRALEDRGGGRLFVASVCRCHGDAFDLRKGQVVLDLKDGPPPVARSPFEAPLPELVVPFAGPVVRAPERKELRSAGVPAASLAEARAGLPLWLPGPGQANVPAPGAGPGPGTDGGDRASDAEADSATVSDSGRSARRVSEIESVLLEQVARAAAQGLLDADLGAVAASVAEVRKGLGQQRPEIDEAPRRDPLPAITPRGHVSVETSVDRALGADAAASTDAAGRPACLSSEYFDIGNWGAPLGSGADIGEYRSHLVGEFDITNGEGVTDLARYYLYITFGAEAKALVDRYPADVVRGDLLVAMAEIMDNGYAESAMALVDQMACHGDTALWAVLAQPQLYRGQAINTEAVALAFSALPAHLRAHLGPSLADKFLAIDDMTTGDMIRSATGRSLTEEPGALALLNARFDLAEGRIDQATARLDTVVADSDEMLPEALLERVDATLENKGTVPEDLVSLLGSVAFERRGSEMGARLKQAEIIALASQSDFEAAFSTYDAATADGTIPADDRITLSDDLFARLASAASDATFLTVATSRMDGARHLPAESRRRLAERFLELGFAAPARTILGGEGALPDKSDRLLFARAALIERRPEVAISYLAGLDGDVANQLRAEALVLAKDHAGAVRVYAELGDSEAQRREAWQGGLWNEVSRLDTGVVGRAARLMADTPPDSRAAIPTSTTAGAAPPPSQAPLARGEALIKASRATRETLDALLQAIQPP